MPSLLQDQAVYIMYTHTCTNCSFSFSEPEELTSARQYFTKTRDAEGAIERLPKGRPLERAVLRGLAERKGLNDYLGALKCVSFSINRSHSVT